MYNTRLCLCETTSVEAVWNELERIGVVPAFSCEDEEGHFIYLDLPPQFSPEKLKALIPSIKEIFPYLEKEINWEDQWKQHSPNFHNGKILVDLQAYGVPHGSSVSLQSGPGFGDLSHPTTNLVLKLISCRVQGKFVVDIGCGSGILSLCALRMGAKKIVGIDIDPNALKHASANAVLNGMEERIDFQLPEDPLLFDDEVTILMNMIRTEQEVAWNSLPALHPTSGVVIVSGILVSERSIYTAQCKKRGWTLLEEVEEAGWLGMTWQRNSVTRNF